MKILKTQTLRGPNYWSIRYPKLIVIRLDLESSPPTSERVPALHQGLAQLLPGLAEHGLSEQTAGFLRQVEAGVNLAQVVQHIALELQTLAGMPVSFGRTRETAEPGIYQVVFEYVDEQAGRYTARAAVRLCQSLVEAGSYSRSELEQDLKDLQDFGAQASLGPSTENIVREAEVRGVPWLALSARSIIQLGYGVHQKRIQATLTGNTGILGVELASDKEGTKRILRDGGIPVPRGTVVYYLDELEQAIEDVGGYPIVIKPLDGNHGRGITINIKTWELAEEAYDAAREVSKGVIVERFYEGRDHRVLVINGKLVAVAERVPAHVVGDGKSTLSELIDETNRDPRRGDGHENILTRIELDRTSWELLERQNFDLDTVLKPGEICYLKATANLSTGGTAIDRTDEIHPENVWIAQRAAKTIGLDIAGIDVVTTDISKPLREVDGVIVEVNAAPGFRMHFCPSTGIPRNVAEPVLDMLFPNGSNGRIPILALTGTNGKTTTTRLLAHIFKQTGRTVGYTTTDGIYIGGYLVEKGDTTGPQSAQTILQDPTVEVAVLETARGGILRSGLGFSECDLGIVLNVAADHLGIGDIDTVEQLAHLKSVVVETVQPNGYAVLNADDPLVVAMAERIKAQIAYFSMQPDSALVRAHTQQGGLAAIYENGYLSILKGDWTLRIDQAVNVPLTMGGRAPFMVANALAASIAAFAQGIRIEDIRTALLTFQASVGQTPGRMNLFNLGQFHAMLDYAHNPHSYEAIGGFVRNWPGEHIGVVGGPGDRRDEDFVVLGRLAAQMFDRILIKEDNDSRGRPSGDAARLIVEGIEAAQTGVAYEVVLDETTAVNQALDSAPAGSLVVIFPESVNRALSLIEARNPLPDLGLPANVSPQEASSSAYGEPAQVSESYAQSGVQSGG